MSRAGTAAKVRLTVRAAQRRCAHAVLHVLDADGTAALVDGVRLHTPAQLGITAASLHRAAVAFGRTDLDELLSSVLLRYLATQHDAVLVHLAPGVLLQADPAAQLATGQGPWFAPRATRPTAGRAPGPLALARDGGYSPRMFALRAPDAVEVLGIRDAVVVDSRTPSGRWTDVAAAGTGLLTGLIGAGSLRRGDQVTTDTGSGQLLVNGVPALALDLAGLDPSVPELMDPSAPGDPSTRLSEHPALAALVEQVASELLAAEPAPPDPWGRTSLGSAPDPALRALYQGATIAPEDRPADQTAPDPIAPHSRDELLEWLAGPGPGGGAGRYLRAMHAGRPDLQRAFPAVPGADEGAYVAWVTRHAVEDGFCATAVAESLRRIPARRATAPSPGVNVVGYLQGELGIGESARLVVGALGAAGVPTTAVSVEQHLASRRRATPVATDPHDTVHDTTVICVNADLTGAIAATVPRLTERSLRIGMWYWEVEEFPVGQHAGFAAVDEVWVATDFVRAAIAPHAAVPVRVMTPPLPQRRELPPLDRASLGIPEGVTFLFSFDYLSTMERKNPLGVVDAYRAAFTADDGTVLVVKSINASQRPVEAERLRRRVADRRDIVLLEDYLDADARDGLVALSDCYVSLHRSEGLGLTMAEAMAWGKPVVATGYSGNLQFMDDQNSFLVPWVYAPIPAGAEPYPVGARWAEPDLDAAARLLRAVVEDPGTARARGAQAAHDISTDHTAAVAGAAMAERLSELERARRARERRNPARALRIPLLRHPV